MKKHIVFLPIIMTLIFYACPKKEYSIRIVFTNPQEKEVKYGGYYRILSTDDTVSTNGYTPGEYAFTMTEDERLRGAYYKDTMDFVDTLHFELYVDGMAEVNVLITEAFSGGEYDYPSAGSSNQ